MSTHFLNANLTEKDGMVLPVKVFARDRKSDEPVWLNFPLADRRRVEALHAAITESKENGAHWVIDIDGLALAVEEGSIEVTNAGHTAIRCTAAQVLQYATCVQNAVPEEVDDVFEALLTEKAQPIEPPSINDVWNDGSEDFDEDDENDLFK
jgi:hypothetical protein